MMIVLREIHNDGSGHDVGLTPDPKWIISPAPDIWLNGDLAYKTCYIKFPNFKTLRVEGMVNNLVSQINEACKQ